uniref:Putative secreted protein n=1 Tax=Anopheles marajoara TaxID=58244 RepID=A0A2M4CCA9_9DIPT
MGHSQLVFLLLQLLSQLPRMKTRMTMMMRMMTTTMMKMMMAVVTKRTEMRIIIRPKVVTMNKTMQPTSYEGKVHAKRL